MTWTYVVHTCPLCGASWHVPKDEPHECVVAAARDERDGWIRLFNRLEATISHHQKAKSELFVDEADGALYAARAKVLRSAANGVDR